MIKKYFCIFFLLFSCSTNFFYKKEPFKEYYDLKIGDLPVFLVASHDGDINLEPLVSIRSDSLAPNFNIKNDINTKEVPDLISNLIYDKIQLKPYSIVNNIHRKYIDLNRDSDHAYENMLMSEYYIEYHKSINYHINNIINKYGSCLLIDIHGFFSDSIDIVLSTRNNNTLSIKGEELILTNKYSFFNNYKTQGYNIKLNEPFYGGYTIKSTKEKTLYPYFSSIQIEIGSNIRYDEKKLIQFVNNTASNIINYLKEGGNY